jgi:hypothetical protein
LLKGIVQPNTSFYCDGVYEISSSKAKNAIPIRPLAISVRPFNIRATLITSPDAPVCQSVRV